MEDAEKNRVTHFLFLGDCITDLPWGNEVYDIIRTLKNVRIIRGNRERFLLNCGNFKELRSQKQLSALFWANAVLSEENRAYIASMPDELCFRLGETNFYANHRPEDIWGADINNHITYYSSWADSHEDYTRIMCEGFKNSGLVSKKPEGIYLFGHFHSQWHCRQENRLIINPGSCGLAGDNETGAEYTLLTNNGPSWVAEERRVNIISKKR